METNFDRQPTVEWLTTLVPGVLWQKGNLAKAVRLWVILRSLYGDLRLPLLLDGDDGWFSNAQWRDAFVKPWVCEKTMRQWLFDKQVAMDETQWRQSFLQRYGIQPELLGALLGDPPKPRRRSAKRTASKRQPEATVYPLYPFQVDDRTFRNDFASLEKLGWLRATGTASQRRYCTVAPGPQPPWNLTLPAAELTTVPWIPNDLATVVDQFPHPINGVQRFILDVEYIIPQVLSRQVGHLLQTLKQLWQQTPVPPVRLTYRSIRYYEAEFDLLTYPVCIYYFQRAPYLFAFGQTPQTLKDDDRNRPNWYDYRLDRIVSLQPLSWDDAALPTRGWGRSKSTKTTSGQTIPPLFAEKTPAVVEQEVASALGAEIHRPVEPLLLRFDRYFYGNYIANTERAKRFQEMDFDQAETILQADPTAQHQNLSLSQLFRDRPRHKSSVFCLTQHRLGDNNVVMRLRAWGPNVEVLLPLSLRQRMQEDTQETWSLYRDS
jgi:CRISPR-associated protein (TIGR03985 family)